MNSLKFGIRLEIFPRRIEKINVKLGGRHVLNLYIF